MRAEAAPIVTATARQHRIVNGGGAGGVPLAPKLGDGPGRDGRVRAPLADRHATHVWKPLLHEVLRERLEPRVKLH